MTSISIRQRLTSRMNDQNTESLTGWWYSKLRYVCVEVLKKGPFLPPSTSLRLDYPRGKQVFVEMVKDVVVPAWSLNL
jgi:hypothetical protein